MHSQQSREFKPVKWEEDSSGSGGSEEGIAETSHIQQSNNRSSSESVPMWNFPIPKQRVMKKVPATLKTLICHYQNQSSISEDRSEEMFLLKMIEWTNSPGARTPFMNSTDPKHSHFLILNSQNTFHIGDQLQVMVHMYDFSGHLKQYGGDYLQARIHTPELKAGSVGTVVDYQNGSYKINFTLFWSGNVEVSVILVHPSEGIQVLKRIRKERPDKVYFRSKFRSGTVVESTICSICLPETAPICNYTDVRTGEPWFCYKPKHLSCTARVDHSVGPYQNKLLNKEESLYFKSKVNLQVSILPRGPGNVTVVKSSRVVSGPGECVFGKSLMSPSGFYYNGLWRSTSCNIHRFNTSASITNCLHGKVIYIYGDSTIRQWFEYLSAILTDLKKFDLGKQIKNGPHLSVDLKNNILLNFRLHGPPIRTSPLATQDMHYIANELDEIKGGKNIIIAFTIWAHFGTFPLEVYIRRIQNIRRAIVRLLDRSPDTQIIIKTANVQGLSFKSSLFNDDWNCFQLDLVLRKMFEGINVAFVDAWEMTLAHYLPHLLHPKQIIIKNEVDVFLSYTCPLKNK
uniref:Neurexophilin and PC-esterase domain family, member 3 n=1 Tax=Callorhinchus milii TaxID=7868 RepID=A0A4W3K777_CALMI|eukprot:gi/632956456/ref/XP_007893967.1/ PREDICTED: NXPE family member 3-like isoform X2 [Callorhinchus milii]